MSNSGSIICPNCGSVAEKNYCSQCGQATHLHGENFRDLIVHFFAHYFHYESKFWQTMKTLCTAPGALTVAYRNKQRVRFVPPISLYIFTVIAYFVLSSFTEVIYEKYGINKPIPTQQGNIDQKKANSGALNKIMGKKNKEKLLYIAEHADKYDAKVTDYLPKIFFFMPPIFGLFLCLLFFDKRVFHYVDHAIFAFHLHIPVFFILLLSDIIPMEAVSNDVIAIGFICWLFYCIHAIIVVYKVNWFRAFISSALAIAFDFIAFLVLLITMLVIMM